MHSVRALFRGSVWQCLSLLFCSLVAIAIIVNVELSGNGVWFWYADAFHRGAKLYAGLHLALQPLFIIEYNAWVRLVGVNCIRIEMLSFLHIFALCIGILLVLRESSWPDWQKAIVLSGTFIVFITFNAYLFNDYHVTADLLSLYAFVLLLRLARAQTARGHLGLAIALGLIAGLALTNRVNDGAALVASTTICSFLIARQRRFAVACLCCGTAILTVLLVVYSTGDTFSDYISNSVLRAAGSKGGGGSLLADPILLVIDAVRSLRAGGKWMLLWTLLILAAGAVLYRYRKARPATIIGMQLVIAAAAFAGSSALTRNQLLHGSLIGVLSILSVLLAYLMVALVAIRFALWKAGRGNIDWDPREFLTILILFGTAAGSASTGGSAGNFYWTMALLLLLVPILQPFRRQAAWIDPSLVTLLLLLTFTGLMGKIKSPYSWHNYQSSPMFQARQWYRHPVYGLLYMEKDQLQFAEPVCNEIAQNDPQHELLSLPYPYPNYFCAVAPWHGYVQTFFDTSTRSTIEGLIAELQADPPQWIVYQRELANLTAHERIYNHGQRLPQRDLDDLIMHKIASGEWQLVDKRNYLEGDGWLVIRTRP